MNADPKTTYFTTWRWKQCRYCHWMIRAKHDPVALTRFKDIDDVLARVCAVCRAKQRVSAREQDLARAIQALNEERGRRLAQDADRKANPPDYAEIKLVTVHWRGDDVHDPLAQCDPGKYPENTTEEIDLVTCRKCKRIAQERGENDE